jgi:ABC-2 type transport system ATP-binding protein
VNALALSGVTKRYGDQVVVDQLDLQVERGRLYGFLGPNGAGKTTTIRILLGLVAPDAGEVELLGERVGGERAQRLEGPGKGGGAGFRTMLDEGPRALLHVGALIEEPAFWPYLSGRRNLECFARAGGPVADRHARLGRIDEVLATVGLSDAGSKKVRAYSQGMRQRLGIALALMGDPDLLVLDEPTNGLDPHGRRAVRVLLRRLADGGTTVFVSSHLLGEVEAMCDEVGVLVAGRLVAEGKPAQLRPAGERLRVEVDESERARALLTGEDDFEVLSPSREDEGAIRVRLLNGRSPAALNRLLVLNGLEVHALVPERDSLEEVFLSVVEGDAQG